MITEKHIPIVTAPNDQLRCGVRSLQHESIQRHPVEIQQVRVSIDSSEVQISMNCRSILRISFLSNKGIASDLLRSVTLCLKYYS